MRFFSKSLLALSLTAVLTLPAHALFSQGSVASEENESGRASSIVSVVSASPPLLGARAARVASQESLVIATSGRVTLDGITQPERTPLLKQRLFVPWQLDDHAFTLKEARALARDGTYRISDLGKPTHRAMLRESHKMVRGILGDAAFSPPNDDRSPDMLRTEISKMDFPQALRFARDFQETWNRITLEAEAIAARNLMRKEALQAQDQEMRQALLEVARQELMDPDLFPLWRQDERQSAVAALAGDGTKPHTTLREIMGNVLLARGRGCLAHCLRDPGLGRRLLMEILIIQSHADLDALLSCSADLTEYRGVLLDPVFPENAHPITAETQARARQLVGRAQTLAEVMALRNSVYGPALMSLREMEMTIEGFVEDLTFVFLRLFPNLRHLIWSWGPKVTMTPYVIQAGVVPLISSVPENIDRVTFQYAAPDDIGFTNSIRPGLIVDWMPENADAGAPVQTGAEIPADRGLLTQMSVDELRRLLSDETVALGHQDSRPYRVLEDVEHLREKTMGHLAMRNVSRMLDSSGYAPFAQKLYATLQTLVQPALEVGAGLAQLDLTNFRNVLAAQLRITYRNDHLSNSGFFPWYVEQPIAWEAETYHRPDFVRYDGPYGRPAVPLEVDVEEDQSVHDFSYLGAALEGLLERVRDEALPLALAEYRSLDGSVYVADPGAADSRERRQLEPVGLFKLKERK